MNKMSNFSSSDCISRREAIDALRKEVEWEYDWKDEQWYYIDADSAIEVIERLSSAEPEIIRCKDCKHFEYDHIENVNGIPLIVAHEICMRWGEGSKTSENGYCFLAERKEK